jgi:sterol 3beta-glucosyltransferase
LGFFLDDLPVNYSPPEDLRLFLENTHNNKPLVYLGFGSMPVTNPLKLLQLALELLERCQCRAVLAMGWAALHTDEAQQMLSPSIASGDLFVLSQIPHSFLFPRVRCIVHHCGVGTMASALVSGVPQIPCPVMLDQPHNAQFVCNLGCAPAAIPYSSLSAKKLTNALQQILANKKGIVQKAQAVAEILRTECLNSIERGAEIILQYHNQVSTTST